MSARQAREGARRISKADGDRIAEGVLRLVERIEAATHPTPVEPHPSVVGSLAWHQEIARREGLIA